jgi:hypothetical protein
MKKYLLAIIFLLCFFSSPAKDIILSLSGEKLFTPVPGYYIEDVILAQQEDSCLGYVNPALEGSYRILFFEHNIRSETRSFLMNSMPRREGLQPLLLRLNRMVIYTSNTSQGTMTRLELSLSLIRRVPELTEDFNAAVSILVYQRDIPKGLPDVIADAFDQCFSQYLERKKEGLLKPRAITSAELNANPLLQASAYPCFHPEKTRKGLFHTWIDFRDNTPDTLTPFTVIYHEDRKNPERSKAELRFEKGSKPTVVWGFCESDRTYVNIGKFCALMTPEGGQFTTWYRHTDNNNVGSAALMGGMLFGIAGAALFGGLASLGNGSDLEEQSRLDLLGGMLVPVYIRDYTRISSNVVFFLSKISDPDATLSVYLDGQLQCRMKPGDYLTLQASCHHPSAMLKVVSSTGGEATRQLDLELVKSNAYLLKVKRNHSIDIDHLFEEVKKEIMNARTDENTVCRVELSGQ